MNEEIINDSSALDDDNQASKRVSYPSKELKLVIEFVAKVYNQLGHTTYHENKAIAAIHGLAPSSIKPYLTAAQQYKLFELKHRIGYKVTEHFQKIYLPKSEGEKRAAVIESLKNPETYQQLFKDYEYHVVPSDGVRNYFKRNYDFKDDIATKAAEVFLANLKDFELLDTRGVLTSALPIKPTVTEAKQEPEESNNDSNIRATQEQYEAPPPPRNPPPAVIHSNEYTENSKYRDHIWIPIHITKNRTAVFAYPEEISENDIKIVEHQLAGILLRIRLENEEKNKGADTPS